MKDRKKQDEKIMAFVLYGILWLLLMSVISAMTYCEHTYGSGTLFDAMEELNKFHFLHWLNPITWGSCIKWSFFYWIGIAMFLIYEQRYKHDMAGKENGSAKWNDTMEEFNAEHNEPFGDKTFSDEPGLSKKTGENLNNKKTPPVPGNPNMIESELVRLSTADMKTHLNNNVFIVGGAGTGKSRFFIKPNVLQMNCSYIVTDPSGELLKSMHNVLVANGYKIKVFNLVDMQYSCKYNPFKYVKTETDVSILVDCFMSNTTGPDQKSGDPFWDKSEKALLSALLFYLVDIADKKYQKFSTVLWMVQLAQMDENSGGGRGNNQNTTTAQPYFGFSIDMPLDELLNGDKIIGEKTITGADGQQQTVLEAKPVTNEDEKQKLRDKIESSLCLTNYKTFKLGGTKTLKSILISAAVRLNPFSIPAIQNLTDDDNVGLEMVGDELTCFFAIIPQTNSTFNFLISMLFSQMFEALYYRGSKIPNSRLNYHVRFLLDEFANIGKIPEFPQKISTCRKYNISTTIVLQSIAQIKMLYKDDYETIIGNCDTSICLGTNEQTTADYFSKKLGVGTITTKSRSISTGKSGGSSSFSKNKRELMLPDEIMTMQFDECIVMMRGINPFRDHKYPLEKHPQFKNTGDASDENLYDLTKDVAFLCKSKDDETAKEAMKTECNSQEKEEALTPKSLVDVLEECMENNPEEDGYYLIKETNKEERKTLFADERKRMQNSIQQQITEGKAKTVFYDGESMDPALLKPLLTKAMNQYGEFIDDVAMACDAITGTGHLYGAGAKDEDCNVWKVLSKMHLETEEQAAQEARFHIYKGKTTLSEETYGRFQEGCKLGYQTIVLQNGVSDDNEDDDDYMNSI